MTIAWLAEALGCIAYNLWHFLGLDDQMSMPQGKFPVIFAPFIDALSRWEYIVGYLPDIWKFGLFPTFNAAKIVLISYLDNIFGLQSHTKSLQSKKSIFTLMGSHIDNSENSIFMSFNDKKIIYEAFWMFKTLYLMVPWSFVTLEPEKIDQILIFQFVQWLCLCDVKYLPLKVFGQRGCLIF